MKNYLITTLLLLLVIPAVAQNTRYDYAGRLTPVVKKEKLSTAKYLSDLSPKFWLYMSLPEEDHQELEFRRKTEYALGCRIYPKDGYKQIITYVSVEISVPSQGLFFTATSINDELTADQKRILKAANLGADISIKVKFKYKNQKNRQSANKVIEATGRMTIVPETEAEFPGGLEQLSNYWQSTIFSEKTSKEAANKIQQATIKFTVNEAGKVIEARIVNTSSDKYLDKLILNAILGMPVWKPAKNAKGLKVKQEFNLPLGVGC